MYHNRYSYSRSRGSLDGETIEGSVIVERQDANVTAYNADVTAKMLLSGMVKPPEWASFLINTLDACTGAPENRRGQVGVVDSSAYHFGGVESPKAAKS